MSTDRGDLSGPQTAPARGGAAAGNLAALRLESFLPYRLSVLANTVSNTMSGLYRQRFDLTIPDWRIMAVLARFPGSSARELVDHTRMDKVAISRSVSRLCDRGLVNRVVSRADRRRSRLSLSPRGEAIYAEIVPLARDYEARLLASLDAPQQAALEALLEALQTAADSMAAR